MGFPRSACALALASLATQAVAQSNELYLLQDSGRAAGESNTLFVDQSLARDSLVAGDLGGDRPATQVGGGNSGEIVAAGQDVSVLFAQGAAGTPAFGNSASVTATGSNLVATLGQFGIGNVGTLSLGANAPTVGSAATLLQQGDRNRGTLSVDGRNVSGTLIQTGDGIASGLSVRGVDTAVTYQIIGTNVAPAGAGPSVFSNAGTVTVRQTVPGSN